MESTAYDLREILLQSASRRPRERTQALAMLKAATVRIDGHPDSEQVLELNRLIAEAAEAPALRRAQRTSLVVMIVAMILVATLRSTFGWAGFLLGFCIVFAWERMAVSRALSAQETVARAAIDTGEALGVFAAQEPIWEVEFGPGNIRTMSAEELDRAFDSSFVAATTRIRAQGSTSWSTLAEVAGLEDADASSGDDHH